MEIPLEAIALIVLAFVALVGAAYALGRRAKRGSLFTGKPTAATRAAAMAPVKGARNNLVTIATFSQAPQAHVLRGRLESEGIPAFVADENTVTANWLYSNAVGGVKLQVRESDVARAREILDMEQ